MRSTKRRRREPDPLASPASVRAVCDLLRERMPDTIPSSESTLSQFLFAVRHVERRPATDTKRGRPSRWPREKLFEAASLLRAILGRETRGRVSVDSFIGQYLPLLRFPSDVADALQSGQINLQEAAQLARLTPQRLGFLRGPRANVARKSLPSTSRCRVRKRGSVRASKRFSGKSSGRACLQRA